MSLYMIVFSTGLLCFTGLVWWHLQSGILDCIHSGHPRIWRLALLLVVILLNWGPLLLGRHLFASTSPFGRALMVISFSWMVLELWFGTAAIALDLWNLATALPKYVGHPVPAMTKAVLRPRNVMFLSVAFTFLAAIIGNLQARYPHIAHYDLTPPCAPPEANCYKILLISDLHITQGKYPSIMNAVDQVLASEKPDLILHAGDFLDGPHHGDIYDQLQHVKRWNAPDGKYAVFGNHDGYAEWHHSRDIHEKAEVTLLGQRVKRTLAEIHPWLRVVGSDDPACWLPNMFDKSSVQSEGDDEPSVKNKTDAWTKCCQIPEVPADGVTILLRHQPFGTSDVPKNYDMMLCGHTHGGQIFPFNFVVNAFHDFRTHRWYSVNSRLRIYICRGTGFWGPPFRFLIPPEITIITLHSQ
ncbi:MAG: metallophosphoesterase [Victivallales bacterium]|nr:metallophosphoesterase [Victivallales bacterium]